METLFLRGPAEEIPLFVLNLNRVTYNRRGVESDISCVQRYVRNSLFTRRDFSTDKGISMLLNFVNAASSVCEDSFYDPWSCVPPEGHDVVVRNLKRALDVVLVRQKDARDTSERWFGVNSVESSVIGESSSQQGVRVSNVVELGEVEDLPESVRAPQIPSTSYSAKIPAKGKRKGSATPAQILSNR